MILENLPYDILYHICELLDTFSLLRLSSVSKYWHDSIETNPFGILMSYRAYLLVNVLEFPTKVPEVTVCKVLTKYGKQVTSVQIVNNCTNAILKKISEVCDNIKELLLFWSCAITDEGIILQPVLKYKMASSESRRQSLKSNLSKCTAHQ